MSLLTKIAIRFLRDKHDQDDSASKGLISFISTISIVGLSLGVTALLVVTSVMNGFEKELKTVLSSFHGHILLFSKAEPVKDPEEFSKTIFNQFKDVTAVSPYFFTEAMLSSTRGLSGVLVEGVDLKSLNTVSKVSNHVREGRLPDQNANFELAVGSEVLRKLGAHVGDDVVLTIPFAKQNTDSSDQDQPLMQKVKIVGEVHFGMYEYDNKYAIANIQNVQKLLGVGNVANAFKILTIDASKSHFTTTAMNDYYVYPMRARDWSTLNQNLFYAIQLEKVVIGIVLMAIVLVASFNIVSTLLMLVQDKKRQVAMLKSLGMNSRSVFKIFLRIGSVFAVLGVSLGIGLAVVICRFMMWKSIVDLPPDVYGLSRLPIEFRVFEWVAICLFVIFLALFSTIWPSLRISRENPVEGLRYE